MTVQLVVKVPEKLRKQARAVAALRNETISDVVRAALAAYVAEALEQEQDGAAASAILAQVASGDEPVYDWEEVKAELDALPSENHAHSSN